VLLLSPKQEKLWLPTRNQAEAQWQPLSPGVLLRTVYVPASRLVQNGDHLIEVIMEVLNELQNELHGETPAVVELWDEVSRNQFTPILENPFSDWVIRRLRERFRGKGIIANREVVIRDRVGDAPGERTDIHVQAIGDGDFLGEYKEITVVIEVKGNWNDELMKAMETQLFRRYLTGTGFHHGIYLVGWFSSTRWKDSDGKKAKVERLNKASVSRQLEAQSDYLSSQSATIKLFIMENHL
jgi:hypothetical protein